MSIFALIHLLHQWTRIRYSGVVAISSVKVTSIMLVVCGSGSPFNDPSMEVANFVCLPLVYLNNKGITWKERASFFTFHLPPFSKPSIWNFGVFASSSVIVGFIRDWNSIWRSKAFQSSIPLLVCLDTEIHFGNSQAVLSAACYSGVMEGHSVTFSILIRKSFLSKGFIYNSISRW